MPGQTTTGSKPEKKDKKKGEKAEAAQAQADATNQLTPVKASEPLPELPK